jgi:hypothetical protein
MVMLIGFEFFKNYANRFQNFLKLGHVTKV